MKPRSKLAFYPKDIDLKKHKSFMGSDFENLETEHITRNIVVIQQKINPNEWTPFSFEDYKKNCSHHVNDNIEMGVLDALTNGGKPVWNTTAYLESGYLTKGHDGKYSVMPKLLEVLEEFTTNGKKREKPAIRTDVTKINLFFIRDGYYECVLTTKDTIERPFHRKISPEIVKAKKWSHGTLVGSMGASSASNVGVYTDDHYFFINAKDWQYNKEYDVYMALSKTLLDNREYYTRDFSESIDRSSYIPYLFEEKKEK